MGAYLRLKKKGKEKVKNIGPRTKNGLTFPIFTSLPTYMSVHAKLCHNPSFCIAAKLKKA